MKSIPIELAEHKALPATTLCLLQKVGPLRDGSFIAMTSLDRDVTYDADDGDGPITYRASTGVEVSNLSATSSLTVDNGESKTLVPIYPVEGITEAMVDNGELDGVEYSILQVNYMDLAAGRHEAIANGPIGEVRVLPGGLITFENRSWSQLLQQNSVCEVDSLTCRVKRFGSQPGDERFPCMYDLSAEVWPVAAVTSVGAEDVREFTASTVTQAQDYFAPGRVLWVTGANAGTTREVEAFDEGGGFTLLFTTRNPIAVGDTFIPQRECSRQWEGHNSCETYGNRPWFRGEPKIPVADTVGLLIPGAGASQGSVA